MKFKDDTKVSCSRFVKMMSVLLFVGGAILVSFGATYFIKCDGTDCSQQKALPEKTQRYVEFDPGSILPTLGILLGSLCIITSFLGCLTTKFMKPCFTCPFALLGIPIIALLFFAASITSGKGFYLDKISEKACGTVVEGGITTGEKI